MVVCTLELRSRGLHQCYDRVTVLCFLARHSIASVYFFKPPAEQDSQKQILKNEEFRIVSSFSQCILISIVTGSNMILYHLKLLL